VQKKKFNSSKKGNKFEKRVYEVFSNELNSNRLWLDPNYCVIKRRVKYFSKDRGKEITVDISIETYLPNESKWSQLLIFECKDYNKLVPVDDVEEFYSKLMQIAGSGIKGVIVTSHGFQVGALNFASSKNIGLVKLINAKNFKWLLTRVAPRWIENENNEQRIKQIYQFLTEENQTEANVEFYGNVGDTFTTSISDFVKHLLNNSGSNKYFNRNQINNENCVVPFMAKNDIEQLSNNIHNKAEFEKSEHSIQSNCKRLKKLYGIKFILSNKIELDQLGFVILGKIEFDPVVITLSSGAQSNKFRLKFTLAHELGHFFLKHDKFLRKEFYSEPDYNNNYGEYVSVKDIRRMEWQANQFASYFLLPEKQFLKEFKKLIYQENILNKGHGVLFIDEQKCNLNSYYKITNTLRDKFRVSRKVVEYRLKNLNLLNDERGKRKEKEEEKRFFGI